MLSRYENATRNLRRVLCIIGFPVQIIRKFFEIAFVIVVVDDTHMPRFETLAYVLHHFEALTQVVIRVSSAFIFRKFAEVCYLVFVKRSSFQSVLNFRKA